MHLNSSEVAVEPRKVEGLDLQAGDELAAVEGLVWVTASDSGRDIILGPGDSIRFPTRARAVVGGLRGKGVKVRFGGAPMN